MKFVNRHNHPVSLVDGREVPGFGEADLTKEQYETPEQWRQLPDLFVGSSAAADKLLAEAREEPGKFDNQVQAADAGDQNGGTT